MDAIVRGVRQSSADVYVYDSSLESVISSVYPVRGGTGGGTLVTVTGNNFGYVA